MSDTTALVRTGRPLDGDSEPSGPALTLDPTSRAADLLRASPRPLASHPGGRTWATLLARPGEDTAPGGETTVAEDRPELLQWLDPEAASPPAHRHPTTETFECLRGTLTVVVDGDERRLDPGETVTVPAKTDHTFRNDTEGTVALRAALPSMRTVRSLYTVWKLDHEGAFGAEGVSEPSPLWALTISADVAPETTTSIAPLAVQRALWATVGRAARSLGYTGIDESAVDDDFWERHVEQPSL
jgi:mannose-6-phosphate isomerase-like protein (cupin superfamily)